MHEGLTGAVNGRGSRQGTGRYKRLLLTALLAVGLSLVLAVPGIVDWTLSEINGWQDELCLDYKSSGPGVWIEDEGKIVCKLLFHRILMFWGLTAILWYLPLALIVAFARHHMRRLADEAGPGSLVQRRDKVVRIAGTGILLAYVVVKVMASITRWYW